MKGVLCEPLQDHGYHFDAHHIFSPIIEMLRETAGAQQMTSKDVSKALALLGYRRDIRVLTDEGQFVNEDIADRERHRVQLVPPDWGCSLQSELSKLYEKKSGRAMRKSPGKPDVLLSLRK